MNKDTNNKRVVVPGILIVLVLVILGGFSGLTFALAGKITNSNLDLEFAKTGLARLLHLFDKKIIADATGNERMIIHIPDEISIGEEPSESEDNFIEHITKSKEIGLVPKDQSPITPAPEIIIKQELKPTPSTELIPTPSPVHVADENEVTQKITICDRPPFNYRVGYIDGIFYQHDLDRDNLKKIVLYAESQWESALNTDLFKYSDKDQNSNLINFTSNYSIFNDNSESGQFGTAKIHNIGEDNPPDQFEINIFREIFYALNNSGFFAGKPDKNYTADESAVTRAVMHQMGHLIGLNHINNIDKLNVIIMSTNWVPTLYQPALSQEDINQIKELCK